METIGKLLLPLDGSQPARQAVPAAKLAAQSYNAAVTVLGCIELSALGGSHVEMSPITFKQDWDEAKASLEEHLLDVVAELRESGVEADHVIVAGRPVDRILERADNEKADLIVMATHGRSGLQRWIMGSVTESILRRSTCPVLTVPTRSHPDKAERP